MDGETRMSEVVLNPWARNFVREANEHRKAGMGEGVYFTFPDQTCVAAIPDPRFEGTLYAGWFHVLQLAGKTMTDSEWTPEAFREIADALAESISRTRIERTIESFTDTGYTHPILSETA